MSENNKPVLITTETEAPTYDFEFITGAFGLIPINGGKEAINPGAITTIFREEDTALWVITFLGGEQSELTDSGMAELQQAIKERAEATRRVLQMQGAPGGMITVPQGRRFRQ